jgi:3-deoxy-D-manno-octulosonic-acid transferase
MHRTLPLRLEKKIGETNRRRIISFDVGQTSNPRVRSPSTRPRTMLLDLIYLIAFVVLLPWVAWRKVSGGRPVAAPWSRFIGSTPPLLPKGTRQRIWLHGVSVGEIQLLSSLSREITAQANANGLAVEFVVSSSTTTGLDLAAKRFGAAVVFPCPLDFTWAVRRVVKAVDADLLVLGELELWPHLLDAARRHRLPIVVANGRLSERSARGYRRVAPLVRRMLSRVTLVSARSAADAARFRALGAPTVVDAGSMKFDGVRGDRAAEDVRCLAKLAGFVEDDIVFLAGSTQAPEEALAIDAYRAASADHPRLRLVIVPRHVERKPEIVALLDASGLAWQARSTLETEGATPHARVLLVDTTGELGAWWGTASIAFVGGSLDGKRGGQNMLEPAAYGAAVCFGPHTRNFADEVAVLLAADAARVVADGAALTAFVLDCLGAQAPLAQGTRAARTVAAHRGATAATAERILALLSAGPREAKGCPPAREPG